MTEKEAWLYLAESISGGRYVGRYFYWSVSGADGYWCLCNSISAMFNLGLIGSDSRFSMENKIGEATDPLESMYMAPLTEDGAKFRISFCKRMAEECK